MSQLVPSHDPGAFLARWRIYFAERFPPLQHGALIAAFCFGVLAWSAATSQPPCPIAPAAFPAAFATTFLLMLQLRVLDEFKDFEDDRRWRPYRPVPRGLVTLPQLRMLWFLAAALECLAALLVDARLVLALLAIWGYSGLMAVEFFVPRWLKAHPLAYMASHIVIVPLMTLQVAAVHWLPSGATPRHLAPLLAMTYLAFCVIEVGRKLRAPAEEQPGVETYTAVWGVPRALAAWLAFMAAASALAVQSASAAGAMWWVAIPAGCMFGVAAFTCLAYLRTRPRQARKRFNAISGLWALAVFLGLGLGALA